MKIIVYLSKAPYVCWNSVSSPIDRKNQMRERGLIRHVLIFNKKNLYM